MSENQETQLTQLTNTSNDIFGNIASQMEAIEQFGAHIAKSGMCGCDKLEQGTIVAFTCLAEKITPMQFSRTYDIIKGKVTKKAAVMLAEYRSEYGGDFEWIDTGDDGNKATIKLTRKDGRELTPVTFKKSDALHLLEKDNWKNNLGEMLRARCVTKALRMHCPEIAAGIYEQYEAIDINNLNMKARPTATITLTSDSPKAEVKTRLDNCSDSLREKALAKILKRFKAAELDSLSDAQCQSVLDAWDAFMDNLKKDENEEG